MNYYDIVKCSSSDWSGFSVVLQVSGCNHKCKSCWGKSLGLWNKNTGYTFDEETQEYLINLCSNNYISNLVLQGGDVLFPSNRQPTKEFLCKFKQELPNKNIVLFTGYTWEQIIASQELLSVVELCDIVVDGKFEKDLKITGEFRGSSNQRYIDVKESLRQNKVAIKEI